MSSDSYEIQSLLYEYAFHLDSGDLQEMANMFAHAKFVAGDGSGVEISGVENILKLYKEHTRIYSDDGTCLLYTSPSPRDKRQSRMPSSA